MQIRPLLPNVLHASLSGIKGENNRKSYSADIFQSASLSFEGEAKYLAFDMVIPDTYRRRTLLASDAKKIFEELRHAKYLDIPQDSWYKARECNYRDIRDHNLSFLDRIEDKKEKQGFVQYYKNLTGFPNLQKVSKNIENELVRSAFASIRAVAPRAKILQIGYNDTCSVGKGLAFPGSDIDGAYIVVSDDTPIDAFKAFLWENTDSRILSFNHPAAFPQVYTLKEITNLNNIIKQVSKENMLALPSYIPKYILRFSIPKEISIKINPALYQYNTDYLSANRSFLNLISCFPNNSSSYPNREDIKNFGFFAETFNYGKILYEDQQFAYSRERANLAFSHFFKTSNLSQIRALKEVKELKSKLKLRLDFEEKFNNWTPNKQYAFIKTLIQASCGDNPKDSFSKYFATGKDSFAPLLKAMGRPEKKI